MAHVSCPTCGVVVGVPDGAGGTFRCGGCGSEFEVQHTPNEGDAMTPAIQSAPSVPPPVFESIDVEQVERPRRRRRGKSGTGVAILVVCVLLLVPAAFIGGLMLMGRRNPDDGPKAPPPKPAPKDADRLPTGKQELETLVERKRFKLLAALDELEAVLFDINTATNNREIPGLVDRFANSLIEQATACNELEAAIEKYESKYGPLVDGDRVKGVIRRMRGRLDKGRENLPRLRAIAVEVSGKP
jgi:hypothetical protein